MPRPLRMLCVAVALALCVALAAPAHAGAFTAGVAQSVQQRHLVKDEITAAELLEHHADYSAPLATQRQFDAGTFTLGYLTPWNAHGYDVAKKVHRKHSTGTTQREQACCELLLTRMCLCGCVCSPVCAQVHAHLPRVVSDKSLQTKPPRAVAALSSERVLPC